MALQQLNHKHLIVTASGLRNPPRTPDLVKQWLIELVEIVEMKVLMGPYAIRCEEAGNEGVTGLVVLSTSHSSAHFWDQDCIPFVKMDLYSCKDFDPQSVIDHFARFEPQRIDALLIDRNQPAAKICQRLSTASKLRRILEWLNTVRHF